jgi:hypothetical protein
LNAGLTFLPDAFTADDRDTLDYNLGASAIYAFTPEFHLLVEWTGLWDNVPDQRNGLTHDFVSLISPGVRYAYNFQNDSQLVLGVAVPIGMTEAASDIVGFFYVSGEAFFTNSKSTPPARDAFAR